jgi:glutathione S-transferase
VRPDAGVPCSIYHLALRDEWQQALDGGVAYRRSTLGKSLEAEGYIHCSFARQVQAIADLVYHGRHDVVLLEIDPARVKAEVRVEGPDGGEQGFPHIYGPLPIEAVVHASDVPLDTDGRLAVNALLGGG